MAKTISLRFKNTVEDQERAKEIIELLRENTKGALCWMCEMCGVTVPCIDGDPLPPGWYIGHTPQGPGPICKSCVEKDEANGEDS